MALGYFSMRLLAAIFVPREIKKNVSTYFFSLKVLMHFEFDEYFSEAENNGLKLLSRFKDFFLKHPNPLHNDMQRESLD